MEEGYFAFEEDECYSSSSSSSPFTGCGPGCGFGCGCEADGGGKDFYGLLGVDLRATADEIRSAYRRLALKWHPDKHSGDDSAKRHFQEICEAYHILMDPGKREAYIMSTKFAQMQSVEDYLARFHAFVLTSSGLGLGVTQFCRNYQPSWLLALPEPGRVHQ
eukprot:jgi/Chlat1/8170/Chrsp76S07650